MVSVFEWALFCLLLGKVMKDPVALNLEHFAAFAGRYNSPLTCCLREVIYGVCLWHSSVENVCTETH